MKKGFTLAEVLITLAIIGIVAVLTIPTLISSYREHLTVTKVKNFHSTINQALLMAINDNGPVDGWDIQDKAEENFALSYPNKLAVFLKPYLKIAKDCGTKSGCIYSGHYKMLNGGTYSMLFDANTVYYKLLLLDGSTIWFRREIYTSQKSESCVTTAGGYENTCATLFFDVNGKNAPNTIGIDLFYFEILKDRVVPAKNSDCNTKNIGFGCAEYIIKHGDMQYLHNSKK